MRECGGVDEWRKVRLRYRLCRYRCRCRCMSKISGLIKIEGRTGTSIRFIHHGPLPLCYPDPSSAPTAPRAILSSYFALGQTFVSPKLSWCFPEIAGCLKHSLDFGTDPQVYSLLSYNFAINTSTRPNRMIDRCGLMVVH